ncbi:MAG: PolC-type DNA polymerase III [Phascolarctobacterium sp.]|nr:PolC-type DNA polymerase III [Phascolarctobacterium sp.]
MQVKYCVVPDKEKFFAFLALQRFSPIELSQLKTVNINCIYMNKTANIWEVHFKCTNLADNLVRAVAEKLTAAFSLEKVNFIFDSNMQEITQSEQEFHEKQNWKVLRNKNADNGTISSKLKNQLTDYTHDTIQTKITEDQDEYDLACKQLYGKKEESSLLWGKMPKGDVRSLDSLSEEENRVVIEGTFVKSIEDGRLVDFRERELKTGSIVLIFSVCDTDNGIYVKVRFDNTAEKNARIECDKFKKKLKDIGSNIKLRIMGNVALDRFLSDEMVMSPSGIMKVEFAERMDNAEIKRVELHCHTKMSKMDGLTPIKELVEKAVKWGHKALAITDHGVVQAFPSCYEAAKSKNLKLIFGMEGYLLSDRKLSGVDFDQEPTDTIKKGRTPKVRNNHIIILAKNETGLRNLYKLVTLSHLRYMHKRPLLPRVVIEEHREGLLLGSACEAGELYRAILAGASDEVLEEIVSFYDYLEIQPTGNNMFLVRENLCTEKDIEGYNRRIYELGKKLGKLTVATCDVHFLNPDDKKLRAILQTGQNYKNADEQPPLYYRTTEEMLQEFEYLGKDAAYEVCVTNTNKIAEMIEQIKPVPDRDQLYSPYIPGAEEAVKNLSYEKAHEWYGEQLPQEVEERLKMELEAIIGNGFSVLYFIAHKLVKHSLDRGYLVGSRGSVGSSFVATLMEITEVNPLQPHYRCPKCKYNEFFIRNEVDSGFDLPSKTCPICGEEMLRDGHDIPFAVFLGFHGDKVPDIDLNFAGGIDPDDVRDMSDQAVAHKYTEELFGRDNVCRAGTISTIAVKTAIGYVLKYFENKNKKVHSAYIARLVAGCTGVKRTTGQHPGGIMVVPRNMDIHYISPMNRPADDVEGETITTHFDYHSINDRLVKLDILGHDDPMVLKMLEKYLQEEVDPDFDPRDIPVGDEATMKIFLDTSSLGVTPEQIGSEVGTFGIPECGTQFVRNMINDVKPKKFSEIVRVSGYSHGTDVWLNNAQNLIRKGMSVGETISTRDDIMTNLIAKGVEPSMAFKTMEYVRKGNAAKKGLESDMRTAMEKAGIPDWYINSCEKIQYLFPKAHAVAYVLMAYRIAYCKVHYPREFYAAYFTVRAPEFDASYIVKGKAYIKDFIKNVYKQGIKASPQDKTAVTYLELANEMMERGLDFEPIDLYESDPVKFKITKNGLRLPLAALSGVGATAAMSIASARDRNNPFISQEDLRLRTKISKVVIERLAEIGVLKNLPETNQIGLF